MRRILALVAAFAALWLTGSTAQGIPIAEPRIVPSAVDPISVMRIRNGQYGAAAERLRASIARAPDDLGLYALFGVASFGAGDLGDAYDAFVVGRFAETYDVQAIAAHASVLRAYGRFDDAVALRTEALWAQQSTAQELDVFLELVDDYRSAGNMEEAWNAAVMAISIRPDRGAGYARLADVLMDLEEWDDAWVTLAVGEHVGPRSAYLARATARALTHDRRFDEATETVRLAARENQGDLELQALRADIATASGDASSALTLLHGARFADNGHPQMMLAEIHALAQLGERRPIEKAVERFRASYPGPVLNSLGLREYPASP